MPAECKNLINNNLMSRRETDYRIILLLLLLWRNATPVDHSRLLPGPHLAEHPLDFFALIRGRRRGGTFRRLNQLDSGELLHVTDIMTTGSSFTCLPDKTNEQRCGQDHYGISSGRGRNWAERRKRRKRSRSGGISLLLGCVLPVHQGPPRRPTN